MDISIRPAIPEDGPAIGRVKVETWRFAYPQILDPAILEALDESKEGIKWQDRVAGFAENEKAWVACDGKTVIGYIVVGPNRFPEAPCDAELQAIYVLPSYHGKGIGRQLLQPAVDWLIDRGFTSMAVFVFRDNQLGVGFYRSLGAEFHNSGMLEIGGKYSPDESYVWKSLERLAASLD